MYKISVPVMNSNFKRSGREKTVEELKKSDAERVFLALDTYETDELKRKAVMAELKDNCAYLKSCGFEVGAWVWTFWICGNTEFKNMRSINGTEIREFMCPTDKSFVEFACGYIKDIANCGVDLIMLDDDFRYGFLGDAPACLCDKHIEMINSITGEDSSLEELIQYISSGGENKYRDAYLKANGDAFRSFATALRAALDEVNPEIRLGACACMSAWDIDGTDASELAHLLAGSTKPFVRLIGAPYWAVNKAWGNSLQDVIELERMERSWIGDCDIEIMAEGDAYPRPRTNCPANYLEGFDTAIRAAGCTDGILKYGIDYWSNADYETGYAKHHMHNRPLYKDIERIFSNKESFGIRVYEPMKKVAAAACNTKINESADFQSLFFSKAARSLAYNTVPTVYSGDGVCGIAFDEAARNLPTDCLKNGLIIDIAAAEILAQRGIDVGIIDIGGRIDGAVSESFVYNNNRILASDTAVYDIKLSVGAEILSYADVPCGMVPLSYRYENADGSRFLVLNINTRCNRPNLLYHYERSRQYAENAAWLSGKRLPAYAYGNPALYIQCKRDESAMAVGLWNFYADNVFEPEILLDREYENIEFINCGGELKGDKVLLTDIAPFGFAGFEVK